MKYAAKITECILMRGEKSLLRSVQISLMKRRSAPHTAQREELKLDLLSGQFRHGFIPIDLRLGAGVVSLRNENFAARLAVSQIPELNILAHRALGDRVIGEFSAQPLIDAMRSMPLFTRRLLIIDQNLIDEISHRIEHGTVSLRHFARRRDGVLKGLSHHPPMHAELPGDAGYRADAKLRFTSDLFKELHLVSCGSPKVRLLCIFNGFIKLPDARTGDAIRRLRRFRSPPPNPAAAWLSAQARPSRALNGFGSDDNIGSSFSISGGDDFHHDHMVEALSPD